jgi:enterochelin esterase-like enzyme
VILNEVKFHSEVLDLRNTMHVLLPQRTMAERQSKRAPKYRVLYLLHGHSDDHTAWQRWTSIERYVEGLNLAVVMPAGYLSFYTDMAYGPRYGQFISEEVPAVVHDLFPLSSEREDTFVAGLSMGGYGAFKLALTYPERFAAAAKMIFLSLLERRPNRRSSRACTSAAARKTFSTPTTSASATRSASCHLITLTRKDRASMTGPIGTK